MLSARALSVEDFFQLGSFNPASVQRDYVWDSKRSLELFNDVERVFAKLPREQEAGDSSRISVVRDDGEVEDVEPDLSSDSPAFHEEDDGGYHLGEVVLRRIADCHFEIYDGLQRATTLTILLCVIRDLTASEELRARISHLIRSGDACRLTLPGSDYTLGSEVQADGQAIRYFRRQVSDRGARIRASQKALLGYLRTWDQNRLSRFGIFLLERTFLVVCTTGNMSLARQVFVTANNRGLRLSPVDIFKGQLFDIAGSDQCGKHFLAHWNAMAHIVGDKIEDFMRAFDFTQRCSPQEPDYLIQLAEHIEKNYGPGRLQEIMNLMREYATVWQHLTLRWNQKTNPILEFDVWRLRCFKWFEWRPVALAWYKQYRDNKSDQSGAVVARAEKTFKQRFNALHRICMIMTLAKFSADDRAKIFGKALAQKRNPFLTNFQRPGALTFSPTQIAKVLESLRTPLYDDEIRLSLLRWLESNLGAKENVPADFASASVEHVLPRRPALDSQWIRDFPDEEMRFAACHSIGNLAIMDHAENEKITNKDFSLKLPVIKEQSNKYKSLSGIADKTCWTAKEIRERADTLTTFICERLNIPQQL